MNRFFLVIAMSAALAAPALAEGMAQDVACSAFRAMSHDDMMAATAAAMSSDAMSSDAMSSDPMATDGAAATTDGAMATDSAMSADDQMAAMVKACTAHPDMMVMDAMHMMN